MAEFFRGMANVELLEQLEELDDEMDDEGVVRRRRRRIVTGKMLGKAVM